mmetsp:Transcript_2558/g.4603  ORF Transcript_2558/g.4603 Transcript_2558/m.4603 type:complete len:92 (+) Transcript_2558:4420-4695(+)
MRAVIYLSGHALQQQFLDYKYIPTGAPSCFLYRTFSFPLVKSAWLTRIRLSRSAKSPASVHMALISAPDISSLVMMNSSRSTSSANDIRDV